MKRLAIYIMVCVASMSLLSCEDLTPEFYQNKPVIEEVRYSNRFHPNYTEMIVTVTLDKNYGSSIRADIGKFTNRTLYASNIYNNIYTCTINVFIDDFDEVNYLQGTAIYNNLDVVIKSCDGTNVTLATYTTGRMAYTNKPSIKMTKVTRDGRYLSDDNYRYTTEYTGYFVVSGTLFFKEIYNYLIGNWSNPGKGGSILPYDYSYYEEGETLSHSTALIHPPSLSETLYNQFRGLLRDNKTEIIADKTISLAGTGDGWVTVSLVSSAVVPYTRSGGGSKCECIAAPIKVEGDNAPKVKCVYTIDQTPIPLVPIK